MNKLNIDEVMALQMFIQTGEQEKQEILYQPTVTTVLLSKNFITNNYDF